MAGHSLFFALRPDAAAAARIADAVTAAHAARGLPARLRPLRMFHITLHYFGAFSGEPDAALVAAAGRAAAGVDVAPFELDFDRLASWGGAAAAQHPFVLTGGAGLDGVRALQCALAARLAGEGVAAAGRAFVPHLTLRYDRQPAPAWELEVAGWAAGTFELVQSLRGETRHEVLQQWPLRG